MADRNGKTEDATPTRRRDARREGNVARSAEASSLAVLAAALIAMISTAPNAMVRTGEAITFWLSNAGGESSIRFDWLQDTTLSLSLAWSPPVLAAAFVGIGVQIAQAGVVLAPKSAKPSLKHISPKRGLQQLNPKQAGFTLLRSVLKVVVVGFALVGPINTLRDSLAGQSDLATVASSTWSAFEAVAWRVVLGAMLIAAIDFTHSRRKWKRDLKMSRQEIIDESKMTEGDPHMKAARKRRGFELRRRRGLPDVSKADVVVTNPTHFAVALAYVDGSPAPQVIDKGTEGAAKRIRKIATRNGVPIIENRPLARALYRQVKVGGYVPERFFDDVIKVLVAAYWRRGKFPESMRVNTQNQSPTRERGAS